MTDNNNPPKKIISTVKSSNGMNVESQDLKYLKNPKIPRLRDTPFYLKDNSNVEGAVVLKDKAAGIPVMRELAGRKKEFPNIKSDFSKEATEARWQAQQDDFLKRKAEKDPRNYYKSLSIDFAKELNEKNNSFEIDELDFPDNSVSKKKSNIVISSPSQTSNQEFFLHKKIPSDARITQETKNTLIQQTDRKTPNLSRSPVAITSIHTEKIILPQPRLSLLEQYRARKATFLVQKEEKKNDTYEEWMKKNTQEPNKSSGSTGFSKKISLFSSHVQRNQNNKNAKNNPLYTPR